MTLELVLLMFQVFHKRCEPQTAGLTALEHPWIQYESCDVPIKNGVPGKERNTYKLLPPLLAAPRDRAIRGNAAWVSDVVVFLKLSYLKGCLSF